MGHLDDTVHHPPDREQLRALAAELVPGGRLVGTHALRGGISQGTHRMEVMAPDGELCRFVLRRFNDWCVEHDSTIAGREWRVLQALGASSVPAARPVWLDETGRVFGRPALVTTLLPGRGALIPQSGGDWMRQLAEALVAVHAVAVAGTELEVLLKYDEPLRATRLLEPAPAKFVQGHRRAREVWAALGRLWPDVERDGPVLVHGDYWPGNTLWRRRRLTGVVDWEMAQLASRGFDVGYTHMDLSLSVGGSAPEEFVAAYERAAGWTLPDRAFWKLLGVWRALADWWEWLPGWQEFGPSDLTLEVISARLDAYLDSALREAESAYQARRQA